MLKDKNDFEEMFQPLKIDDKPNPAHRAKLRWQMLSAFNKAGRETLQSQIIRQNIRRKIMKSPITKLAAAAVLIVAVIIGAHQLTPSTATNEKTGSPDPIGTPDDKPAPNMAPVDIELPMPVQGGTLEDHRVPNLEKKSDKLRPPFLAPVGTKNVALGKPVSGSDEEPIIGELELITDGDKETADGSYVELGPFAQHVMIDLEALHNIYAVVVWHYHKQPLAYFDVVVQVADDPDFITNVRTIFNNDIDNSAGLGVGKDKHYGETYEGKLIDAKGLQARYIRLHSAGSTSNDMNHYIEVEVYGKPAAPAEKLVPLDMKVPKPSYIY